MVQSFSGGYHYILIPQEVVDTFKGEKRVIFKVGEHKVHCAIQRGKEIGHYIYLGAGNLKKLDLEAGMEVEGEIVVDTSKYQFEMPEEMAEVLQLDPEADKIFHSLTPGNQRSLIHLVGKVKSTDKRIEKALKIAEGLKRGITSARYILKS